MDHDTRDSRKFLAEREAQIRAREQIWKELDTPKARIKAARERVRRTQERQWTKPDTTQEDVAERRTLYENWIKNKSLDPKVHELHSLLATLQYHLETYTRSPTNDNRVVQVQDADLGNGLKKIFAEVATIALGMFDRANESQCRVIVTFNGYQLGIYSIITAITTAVSNITIYDQVITHRQPFHYLKPVDTLQVGDAGTITGFKNRLQSWFSQSFAQNPAYTTLHTVMTSGKR